MHFAIAVFLDNQIFPRSALAVWYVFDQACDAAIQRLAYSVQMFKVDPLCHLMVQLIDSCQANTHFLGQPRLAPALFSEDDFLSSNRPWTKV